MVYAPQAYAQAISGFRLDYLDLLKRNSISLKIFVNGAYVAVT
jgi:hypothetical protein